MTKKPSTSVTSPPPPATTTASTPNVKSVGLTILKSDKGYSVMQLNLSTGPQGPEIVSWELLGEEAYLPRAHAVNLFKINAAQKVIGVAE